MNFDLVSCLLGALVVAVVALARERWWRKQQSFDASLQRTANYRRNYQNER